MLGIMYNYILYLPTETSPIDFHFALELLVSVI